MKKPTGKEGKRPMEELNNRLTYSPTEAAQVLGVSRPTIYTLIKREDFPAFKVGARTLISVLGLQEWVDNQAGNGCFQ